MLRRNNHLSLALFPAAAARRTYLFPPVARDLRPGTTRSSRGDNSKPRLLNGSVVFAPPQPPAPTIHNGFTYFRVRHRHSIAQRIRRR